MLYQEIIRRFPEVKKQASCGDHDLPYVMVGYIADWLLNVAVSDFDLNVIRRVVEFDHWCMAQRRGKTAEDDIMTIEVVSLREKLFEHDALLPLIPHLMTRDELLENREYFEAWVGADRYRAAMRIVIR